MKKYIVFMKCFTVIFLLGFLSCSENDPSIGNKGDKELRIAPSVGDLVEAVTRATGNDFFIGGDEIDVFIRRSSDAVNDSVKYTYVYGADGIFIGNPAYEFNLDDSYISTLTAVWPANAPAGGAFEADQREYENYRKADWLVASASASGIMATNIPVPLQFQHNNCLLEFELAGQNANGLEITELLIELEVDGVPTACWAYCGNENGRASFLLKAGTRLSSDPGTLIGTIPGAGGNRYTIVLPEMDMPLEAGKRYLVTLTPQGYDMDIFVFIGTFASADGERETGIAVPFHLPDQGEEGDYIIRTPIQLVTASYVVRHYTDGNTPNFPGSTFVLTDDFQMTEEAAALYIPIPETLFTGQFILNGTVIDSLPYGDGQVLELFTNE